MQKTIEKIHRKFDTAGEKLLAEAKTILANEIVYDPSKTERLNKIGFTKAKPIKDLEELEKKQTEAREIIEAIEYYQTYYPSYKFISEKQIEKICKKYGLLYGESENYLGDIPEKNIQEIESFKLREDDYYNGEYDIWGAYRRFYSDQFTTYMAAMDSFIPGLKSLSNMPTTTEVVGNKKPPFKICAPKHDFNTDGYEIKDGYKLIYDPIVIQPVKYGSIIGGLVVSKWGLEAQDESLINEKNN